MEKVWRQMLFQGKKAPLQSLFYKGFTAVLLHSGQYFRSEIQPTTDS